MYVVKRDGRREDVLFDKITVRIKNLCYGLNAQFVQPAVIAQKVVAGVYPGVTTKELDELAAQTAAYMSTNHPDFSVLAARIAASNLHKQTPARFSECVALFRAHVHKETGNAAPLVSAELHRNVLANAARIDAAVQDERDFQYDYFGFKTLERSYLLRIDGQVAERPQHMLMRVAVGIHGEDVDAAIETYDLMSRKFFTHATPTLYNAGTPRPQLSSCFLLQVRDDSIEGIYDTLKQCACISKYAGGIGLSIHNIRATNSYICGTNGTSNGIVPMLRVFSDTARYVDQGGGKRKGSFAMYLEPWHADVFEFLELKKNHGNELQRARDLFYAMWIPDLFMQRVKDGGDWSLFCPNECPRLHETHGPEFVALYVGYEAAGKAKRVVKAQALWFAILESQVETGTPYMLYKDACNAKSNQQNLGTIKCSNLCTEIVQFTSPGEVAVCNLASLNLQAFVEEGGSEPSYNFLELAAVTRVVTRNLNKVIDVNYYPVPEARASNLRHRPIGLGVQGLADTFIRMRYPFESEQAAALNRDIFETIYYAALDASCALAQAHGPYASYAGSPVSRGVLQFDMWGVTPASGRWDWAGLRARIAAHGVRNSLLVAPMPTASTAQIMGNNESTEPFTSNMYSRRVLAGEFAVVNKYLLNDLIKRGLWDESMRNHLLAEQGSVQAIPSIPSDLKALYKTVWEIKQRAIIDMAADRGAFIDQSQSLNIHIAEPTVSKLTSMHFYAWGKGLKTGMYYLRSRAKADAIQFTVDQGAVAAALALAKGSGGGGGGSGSGAKEEEEDEGECVTCSA